MRPVRLFLPSDYQPKYAYPLVVVFHADGGDENVAARVAPLLSRRNYIAACPRGPLALGRDATGRPGFAWGDDPRADEYLLDAVAHARREYHVHSERVYLIGIGEGATTACRLARAMAGDVAGIVALNGRPLCGLRANSGLRVFVAHGASNPVVRLAAARKASRLLQSTGADVRFESYPTTHRVHPDMLRDVNRWIMGTVSPDPDSLTPPLNS
jgi:phospholipase/carboxylesterase